MIGLLDCNNFYVSCERVFDPTIAKKSVVVLSNQDGCVIARSNEAKALGIEMGVPFFQIRALTKVEDIAVYSSNYALYGDMSSRVVETVRAIVPEVEVYSIDEQFLDFDTAHRRNAADTGQEVRTKVGQHTGIPTGLGIARTKTLAKIANRIAKKSLTHGGIYVLDHPQQIESMLALIAVSDLWGIGRRYAKKLGKYNVNTALDLYRCPESFVQQQMTVVGLRLWHELHGRPCLPLEQISKPKKNICTSRSFQQVQTDLPPLREAIATHANRCAQKLRAQGSAANYVQVFVQTNKHCPEQQYANSFTWTLPVSSNDSRLLIRYALQALERIFQPGYHYQKCGVIVSGLVPENAHQLSLFEPGTLGHTSGGQTPAEKGLQLMQVVDTLNDRYGRDKVQLGAMMSTKETASWRMQQNFLSPQYTTRFKDIPIAWCV